MITNGRINYSMMGTKIVIPAGVQVTSAGNNYYYVEKWDGMTEGEEIWQETYGFMVEAKDVCEYK